MELSVTLSDPLESQLRAESSLLSSLEGCFSPYLCCQFHFPVLLSCFQTFLLLLVVTSLSKMWFCKALEKHHSITRKDKSWFFSLFQYLYFDTCFGNNFHFMQTWPTSTGGWRAASLTSSLLRWSLWPAQPLILPKLCLAKSFMTSSNQYKQTVKIYYVYLYS